MSASVLWFRRDLRLGDHPALDAAAEAAGEDGVVPLFVLDDALLRASGPVRTAWVLRSLHALDRDLREHGTRLLVRHGRPEQVVPAVAAETGAGSVHISADFAPYGKERDERVRQALGTLDVPVDLTATGSPYAVAPGRVRTRSGGAFQVYGPFYRAWVAHGWRGPAHTDANGIAWALSTSSRKVPGDPLPKEPAIGDTALPEAGEAAALATWADFRDRLADYPEARERADKDGSSRLSPYLKIGSIHPRTLLAGLGPHDDTFRRELAWREFYAAVLDAWPASARDYFRPELRGLPYVTGAGLHERLEAWRQGRTGYPLVDAGMRQLLAQGWMHNRVRMLVASFLVKDLHIEWQHGARHFLRHLIDGDLASNQHNWQWVAGCGTDAAPYFRIFNPVTQSKKFDPDGAYIRRWIPELRSLEGRAVHEPWKLPDGPPDGYPTPIVDHAEQRADTLAAYEELRRG
ncbi:deoxyribodipyrimidine photo-lyase [Nocardioides sp. BP30]|uniref:cryptochrome/photolyase family protein n=1 Tax=Nocardioides sp. BP30 TaxID=3036374 RepID=UPI00246897A6|nr:deoxyribodipyrimidine photo-lyase [Nocardioides sp. BP30]WGL51167.1 deoxyribodipyrimidine photo-lyase [Nocardioides sp. BP30]